MLDFIFIALGLAGLVWSSDKFVEGAAAIANHAGMSPLLGDAFFMEMAVCIMTGLAFATLLTLIAVPVFYRVALGNRVTSS